LAVLAAAARWLRAATIGASVSVCRMPEDADDDDLV
jgi:hypothetical protein